MKGNQNTENVRTLMNNDFLKESTDILQSIVNVCTDVRIKEISFSQACRKYNLDPNNTRKLILNQLGKCCEKRVDLSTLEFDFKDGFECFYKEVFGDRTFKIAKLPVDYKESVLYVLNKTNLTEKERLSLKYRFGLEDGDPKTLNEVGDILNIEIETVRQHISKGLRKCRARSCQDILKMGLAAYNQMIKQQKELARQDLQHKEEEHKALMTRKEQEHKDFMANVKSSSNYADVVIKQEFQKLKDIGTDVLNLTVRTHNALSRNNIRDLKTLMEKDQQTLLKIRNLGKKGIEEITNKLNEYVINTYGITIEKFKETSPEFYTKNEII